MKPKNPNAVTTTEGYSIFAGQERPLVQTYNWASKYGKLAPGHYRVTQGFMGEGSDVHIAAAEFDID